MSAMVGLLPCQDLPGRKSRRPQFIVRVRHNFAWHMIFRVLSFARAVRNAVPQSIFSVCPNEFINLTISQAIQGMHLRR